MRLALTLRATDARDGMVRLWESATGLEHETLEAHSAAVMSVSFSQDGTLMASASFDGTIKLWQL
jgi:WD40 repeat protein